MSPDRHFKQDLSSLSREELEIRLRQCLNDLRITREESHENSLKYMEMVGELGERNLELQSLKDGLEDVLQARNAELLLAREGQQGDFAKPSSHSDLKNILETCLSEALKTAGRQDVNISAPCQEGLRLERSGSLPAIVKHLAAGLLSCCGQGEATLEAIAEKHDGELSIKLRISGAGVDRKRRSTLLKSCKPVEGWEGVAGLLPSLTGWSLSVDSRAGGFHLNAVKRNASLN